MISTELLDQLHTNVAMCMELGSEVLSLPCMLRQKHIIHSEQPKNIIHGLVKSISCADLFVGQYFI